jgi:hypothetical protein
MSGWLTDGQKMTLLDDAAKESEEIRKIISPPNSLGLSRLLDDRRYEFAIPDCCFGVEASFDRIIIKQVTDYEGKTYIPGGKIEMPDSTKGRLLKEAPRGVLVSAGLRALDELRSNGIDVGHVVRFVRNAPYRFRAGVVLSKEVELLMLRSGDIVGSEDLSRLLREGKVKKQVVEVKSPSGDTVRQHIYTDEDGNNWNPALPWISDDM